MAVGDYPIDVRTDYPERSSRGWAVLTILLIKFLALIPHFFVLVFLGIAQFIVAFVAQIVVAANGVYPAGMFDFVVGVLRWGTRVSAFILSVNDRYPPFTLQPVADYPLDVVIERPEKSDRLYALFTVIVQVLFIIGLVALGIYLARHTATTSGTSWRTYSIDRLPGSGSGLLLRQIAALPHLIVLAILGFVVFVLWVVVQWVILFVAGFPRGMWDIVAGYIRWQTRVTGYALGLSDRYPPFTFDPSLTAAGMAPAAGAATGPPTPAAPAPPAPAAVAPTPLPAQWYADPTGRHAQRYWDGTQWTSHVADNGALSEDPLN